MDPAEHLVVVGASLAGLRAVEAARRSGFAGRITLIGAEDEIPYDRPPLSKAYLQAERPTSPTLRSRDELAALDVDLRLGAPATGLDTQDRRVVLGDSEVGYGRLVIATGARARSLPAAENLRGVHTLRTLADADAVRAGLDRGDRLVVVGAGFIGSEVASAARTRGLAVTLVEAAPIPLVRAVGEQMGAELSALHARNGSTLRCGVGVERICGDGTVESVVLADGTVLEADLVVAGIGADPVVEWLTGSGLEIDNGIVCDENLWTGVDGVYAAGDVARWFNPTFGRVMRVEHWSCAAEQGARAAANAVGPGAPKPYSTVPYFWSDWYGTRIQFVGTPLSDAVVVVDGDLAGDGETVSLYRTGDRLTGALVVDRPTEVMKYRAMIARGVSFEDAVMFAGDRRDRRVLTPSS